MTSGSRVTSLTRHGEKFGIHSKEVGGPWKILCFLKVNSLIK